MSQVCMSNPVPIGEEVEKQMEHSHEGYRSSHPWYYLLGGKRLSLKEIREDTRVSGYGGYLARDIDEADNFAEPRRSQTLRQMRDKAQNELSRHVSCYRELARQLARRRCAGEDAAHDGVCADIHQNICLKHNHISNEFAHLITLERLLAKQGDLFDLIG